jgi:hypothetical protein
MESHIAAQKASANKTTKNTVAARSNEDFAFE